MKELELIVGARVYCRNGKFGRLAKIAVEPRHWRVTHIVVEEGFLKKRFRVLPISLVEQATTGDVYLGVCDEDLTRFPAYEAQDGEIAPPADGQNGGDGTRISSPQGLPPGLVVVERGTPVENGNGTVGRLDYVLVQPGEGTITGFVLQRLVPNTVVQHIDGERISVADLALEGQGTGL